MNSTSGVTQSVIRYSFPVIESSLELQTKQTIPTKQSVPK
jgi:hypothetical protein